MRLLQIFFALGAIGVAQTQLPPDPRALPIKPTSIRETQPTNLLNPFGPGTPVNFSGRVTDPGGTPLEGAKITLYSHNSISAIDPGKTYEAISNEAGNFSFAGIPSGSYQVFTSLSGYIADIVNHPSEPVIRIPPNQNITDYRFILARQATVSGRVLSKRGNPIEGVMVLPETAGSNPNVDMVRLGFSIAPFGPVTYRSNERGEYSLRLPPGKLKLRASASYDASIAPVLTDIELAEGEQVPGRDIVMQTPTDYSISGRVIGLNGKGVAILQLARGSRLVTVQPNGEFHIEPVTPGDYFLMASDSGQHRSNPISVSIQDHDISGIELTVRPILEISGTVDGVPLQLPAVIWPESIGARGIFGGVAVAPDGSFTIRNLPPDRYRFHMREPGNAYIREMTVNGEPVADAFTSFIDLTNTPDTRPKIAIVVANGAEVHGTVNGASSALVVLIPEGAGPDQAFEIIAENGKYQLRGIRPGRYRIVAIASSSGYASLIETALQRAEPIEIPDQGSVTRDLTPIVQGPQP